MLERLAIHTITNQPWSTEQCIENYAKAGVGGITFWRYSFDGRKPEKVGQQEIRLSITPYGLPLLLLPVAGPLP